MRYCAIFNKNKKNKGIALLLTMIILSVVLLMATLVVTVTITQLNLANDINYSTVAIYAADSGIDSGNSVPGALIVIRV